MRAASMSRRSTLPRCAIATPIRSVLDALAASGAAKAVRSGDQAIADEARRLVALGRAAVAAGDVRALVAADISFHQFIYEASGNPLIAPTAEIHWRFLRRVMSDVVRHAQPPVEIWTSMNGSSRPSPVVMRRPAGRLAEAHVERAAERLTAARQRMEPAA